MTKLEKHRYDYRNLKKTELLEIIEEQLLLNEKRIGNAKKYYKKVKSTRNNAKRAIKRLWANRSDIVTRARIKKHIKTLKDTQ